jgi:hypothetical protein
MKTPTPPAKTPVPSRTAPIGGHSVPSRALLFLICLAVGLLLPASFVGAQSRDRTAVTSPRGQPIVPTREYHLGEENKLEITVNIWGEVGAPGSYRVADDTDLVKLISLAGGPTDYANLKRIKISRPNGHGEQVLNVDLLEYLEGRTAAEPIGLMPGDTVRVTKNAKHMWRSAIGVLSDVAVIATLYVLIHEGRYR